MPRVRKGAARRQARKRIVKAVKGHRGAAGRLYRLAKEAGVCANVNARIDRKRRKRDFRGLWITRLKLWISTRVGGESLDNYPLKH